jgi:hypothetical protein
VGKRAFHEHPKELTSASVTEHFLPIQEQSGCPFGPFFREFLLGALGVLGGKIFSLIES